MSFNINDKVVGFWADEFRIGTVNLVEGLECRVRFESGDSAWFYFGNLELANKFSPESQIFKERYNLIKSLIIKQQAALAKLDAYKQELIE